METVANWRDRDTYQPVLAAPVQGDSLTFDGTRSSANLTNLHGFGLDDTVADFASVSFIGGYSGTVTLTSESNPTATNKGIAVGAFTLNSGAISQPAANTDLTVLGDFAWTGGTLNSSAFDSNVNLFGNGSIAPANAGTVFLGSTLTFAGAQPAPKETTIDPGTIQLINTATSIVIGAFSTLKARTFTEGDIIGITKNQAGAQKIQVLANATLWYFGPGSITNNLPVENAGKFTLSNTVRATLSGGSATAYDYSQSGDGKFHFENGSVLTVTHEMLISGGSVYVIMNPNLPATSQTATVNGKFRMEGGTLLFSPPIGIGTTPLVYGTFTVNGDVNWTGGTYMPSVDYTTAGLANKWIVNGTMTSGAACIVQPNPQRGQNPPASSNWEILDATTTAGNMPTVAAGSPLTLGQFNQGARKLWKLTS